ncbi:2-hydroxyhepta-2,4-diene-1,7-dioate isomerase [Arthrobacter livingstonensis]|uniref:2-hydroxyhepta-2,4-diene-1,7-dioate isomerase n=1 Tax=Arthrobacter livingstonensis TaxID=670078 RepID=A0A2V5LFE1_9MICC|nr:fumarylacetoacetate hydrolase family protein [Arthrobacter livingstonensis]PYI69464.1 2-hydroxyhepta-2,4-diene-1,7-dioate isomerase [Arthrobacter livingstonensis]
MKLATLRTGKHGTTAALSLGVDGYLPLPARDVGQLLNLPDWKALVAEAAAQGGGSGVVPAHEAELASLLPAAGKVICAGLNYADHIQEMGRELPEYPTLFAKYADTLIGAADTIEVYGSGRVDWEAELAVVVGAPLTRAGEDEASRAIAGYTVANDVSMRDWQNRTLQWFQGKAFDATTPLGPVLATADEFQAGHGFEVRGYVNGEPVQHGNTGTLVFGPARLLSYISQFTTLRPGDMVLTGTPGGVGMGMMPPRFLKDGDILSTEIDGIGRLENRVRIRQGANAAR